MADKRLVAALMESLATEVITVKEEEVCRREKGWKEKRERVVMAAWWLCWHPVVEMVVDMVVKKLVVALFGGWNSGEREGNKNCSNGGRGAGFRPTLDPIVSLLRQRNAPLFIGLVWLVSIPTVGSKCAPRTAKFDSPRLLELATLCQSSEQF